MIARTQTNRQKESTRIDRQRDSRQITAEHRTHSVDRAQKQIVQVDKYRTDSVDRQVGRAHEQKQRTDRPIDIYIETSQIEHRQIDKQTEHTDKQSIWADNTHRSHRYIDKTHRQDTQVDRADTQIGHIDHIHSYDTRINRAHR